MGPMFSIRAYIDVLRVEVGYQRATGRIVRRRSDGICTRWSYPNPFKILILTWLTTSCLFAQSHGTVVVIFRSNDRLIVGADGLALPGAGKPGFPFCKITPDSGGWTVVAAGVYGAAPMDIFTIAAKLLRERSLLEPIEDTVKRVGEAMQPLVRAGLLKWMDTDQRLFNKLVTGDTALTFDFVGFEGRVPVILAWALSAKWDGKRNVTVKPYIPAPLRCPGQLCVLRNGEVLMKMGDSSAEDAMGEFVNKNPGFMINMQPAAVKQLIAIAVDSDRDKVVGHPIDVLVIDNNGRHWYDREAGSVCPEQINK
jgi:hypothetical protein